MKEHPILFSAPMVRAILEGRKTQTRRVVKLPVRCPDTGAQLAGCELSLEPKHVIERICPYGTVGDRLWVRETWSKAKSCNVDELFYRADGEHQSGRQRSLSYVERESRWRPSIHMPRWASRITLEVTGVRVERLQDISQADCVAEGMPESTNGFLHHVVADYRKLWGDINGADSWAANPWVWVIEFKQVKP